MQTPALVLNEGSLCSIHLHASRSRGRTEKDKINLYASMGRRRWFLQSRRRSRSSPPFATQASGKQLPLLNILPLPVHTCSNGIRSKRIANAKFKSAAHVYKHGWYSGTLWFSICANSQGIVGFSDIGTVVSWLVPCVVPLDYRVSVLLKFFWNIIFQCFLFFSTPKRSEFE
jgi:hypothetical protein